MSTHKHIDRIALLIILTVLAGVLILFAGMGASGERTGMEKEYAVSYTHLRAHET